MAVGDYEKYLKFIKEAIELLTENCIYIEAETEDIHIRLSGNTVKNIELRTPRRQIIHFSKDKTTDVIIYVELLPNPLVSLVLFNMNNIQLDEMDVLQVMMWI